MTGEIRIRRCDGGPLLVRGADVLVDEGGNHHDVTRPVVAVCTCGRSAIAPWCDGTHKSLVDRQIGSGVERPLAGDSEPLS